MNLELAVVNSCNDSGCQVKSIKSGDVLTPRYSALVRDRIWIQAQQLVAVDQSLPIPEIVWRWLQGTVIEVNKESIGIEGRMGKRGFALRVTTLPLSLSTGDEVWFCKTDQELEVHDMIADGKPANPNRLLEYISPIIERVYEG